MGLGLKKLSKGTTNVCSTDETKTFRSKLGQNLYQIFSLSDKWYVRKMKLVLKMKMKLSGKLKARQVIWISASVTKKKKDASVALGTPSVTLKILRKWRISSEQRI